MIFGDVLKKRHRKVRDAYKKFPDSESLLDSWSLSIVSWCKKIWTLWEENISLSWKLTLYNTATQWLRDC